MRAFVISGPGQGEVREVEPPRAEPGLVVVEVDRVGLCGTDEELFSGGMSYLHTGEAAYPIRPGHEWSGRVVEVGEGVDASWMGARVTADTMLGDGTCHLCRSGRQHLCPERYEIGIRRGWPGALAERLPVPEARTPPPARRSGPAARAPSSNPAETPSGPCGPPACDRASGSWCSAPVRSVASSPCSPGRTASRSTWSAGASGRRRSPRSLGFEHVWTDDTIPDLRYDAAVDASSAPQLPARAIELVDPGRRVALIGIAGSRAPPTPARSSFAS